MVLSKASQCFKHPSFNTKAYKIYIHYQRKEIGPLPSIRETNHAGNSIYPPHQRILAIQLLALRFLIAIASPIHPLIAKQLHQGYMPSQGSILHRAEGDIEV